MYQQTQFYVTWYCTGSQCNCRRVYLWRGCEGQQVRSVSPLRSESLWHSWQFIITTLLYSTQNFSSLSSISQTYSYVLANDSPQTLQSARDANIMLPTSPLVDKVSVLCLPSLSLFATYTFSSLEDLMVTPLHEGHRLPWKCRYSADVTANSYVDQLITTL